MNQTNGNNYAPNLLFHPLLSSNFISFQPFSIFVFTFFLLAKYTFRTKLQNIESRNHKSQKLIFTKLLLQLSASNVALAVVIMIYVIVSFVFEFSSLIFIFVFTFLFSYSSSTKLLL